MISAVILTKNSVRTIRRTLESVVWADEVICIDDYSTDETVRIAQKMNAKVIKHHLENDFSAQRNFGLSVAKGEWVLFIDSDEEVPKNLKEEIQDRISRQGTKGEGILGYFLKREDTFHGKKLLHGETAHIKLLRLAKKGHGIWIRPVHEFWDIHGKTDELHNPLIHEPHIDVAQFVSDINWYSTINAFYLKNKGVHSNTFQILVYPSIKFLQNYFVRRGFLDGMQGFIMALMMSFHSFLTRAKLFLLQRPHKP